MGSIEGASWVIRDDGLTLGNPPDTIGENKVLNMRMMAVDDDDKQQDDDQDDRLSIPPG